MRIILTLLLSFPFMAFGQELSVSKRLEDFDQLRQLIYEDYGPFQYKENKLGLNIGTLSQKFRDSIPQLQSDQDFYYHIIKYVAEFRDSHFDVRVPSDFEAFLGFSTDYIDNKVLIDHVDRKILSESSFPFSRGDEIVAVNQRFVSNVIDDLQEYFGMGNNLTEKKLAVFSIPQRQEKFLPKPTNKTVTLTIKKRVDASLHDIELDWKFKGNPYQRESTTTEQPAAMPIGKSDWCASEARIKMPSNAVKVDDVPFTAYYFPTEKGNVGFLRLPHYYPKNAQTGMDEFKERFQQYERTISVLETNTVGLLIDQDYNCGGSVVYLQKILSLFVNQAFEPMLFEFRASKAQAEALTKHLKKFDPHTDAYFHFQSAVLSVEDAVRDNLFSTSKIPFWGFMEYQVDLPGQAYIEQNPIHYTKPIVVLINEMSGSGGDVFPGMIKDLGRAKLFGKTTMGAGGHAWDDPPLTLKNSGLKVNLTRSLIYRPNGKAIENNGVAPDVEYEITEDDFLYGYKNYFSSATEFLLQNIGN